MLFLGAGGIGKRAEGWWSFVILGTIILCAFEGFLLVNAENEDTITSTTNTPLIVDVTKITPGGTDKISLEDETNDHHTAIINNKPQSDAPVEDKVLHNELTTLLSELREIADSIDAVRKEHGKLAKGVNEINLAVKDMNEKSEHIKKKVRKMSKALNKNGHHHKFKNSLRNLQKDHQKILQAMMNSSFSHHRKNGNHSMNHRNKNGAGGMHKNKKNNCANNPNHPSCPHHNESSVPEISKSSSKEIVVPKSPPVQSNEVVSSPNTTKSVVVVDSSSTTSPEDLVSSSSGISKVPVDEDNTIPEPVIEPQGQTETPKKTPPPMPIDCTEVIQLGNMTSGVYGIQPKGMDSPVKVFCDHTTQGGGWTMLVARFPQEDGQEDFNKNWEDYKKGFGDPAKEHWIGNEALHMMTSNRRHELRLNITDWNGSTAWAEWKDFQVGGEDKFYALTVGRYASGSSAGDAMKWHNGMKFSTPDRDNDALMGGQCAVKNSGGWWYRGYRGCYQAHPTGKFQHNPRAAPKNTGKKIFDLGPVLAWQNWRGDNFFPKKLFLMFRPVMP